MCHPQPLPFVLEKMTWRHVVRFQLEPNLGPIAIQCLDLAKVYGRITNV